MSDDFRSLFPLDAEPGPATPHSAGLDRRLVDEAMRAAPSAAAGAVDVSLIGTTAVGILAGVVAVGLSAQVWLAPEPANRVNTGVEAAEPADDVGLEVEPEETAPATTGLNDSPRNEPPPDPAAVTPRDVPDPGPQPTVGGSTVGRSVADRLAEANRLRAGRAWARAERVYRSVAASDPGSQAAYAALIAAGGLNLDHLGRPREALRLFRHAARREGPLDDQARSGVARSLERLGQRQAAARAWARLAETHPQSVLAEAARRRAEELRGQTD